MKSRDPILGIRFDEIGILRVIVRVHEQRRVGSIVPMKIPQLSEMYVEQRIAVDHHELISEAIECGEHGTGGAARRPSSTNSIERPKLPFAAQ